MTTPPETPIFHTLSVPEALEVENVDQQHGLSDTEAAARREKYGPNRFTQAKREPWWRAFVRQYADPMQIVLLIAGLGSLYPLKQWGTGVMLIALTLLNAALGLHQEGKAAAAIDALQKMMIVKARVRRGGKLTELPAEELVPGDVVEIEAGDVIPADGRLLRASSLEIDESALTGESLPVAKNVDPLTEPDTDLGDRSDMAYMNTNVTRGAGELLVTATGMTTEVGRISGMLQADKDAATPLTRQLAKLTNQILYVAGFALLASVLINLARGNEFTVVFTAAVAFAVSAIPTGLPAVVTTILSMGTQLLAKANAIVKRLRSTETLGSTSAINSDKTGTLTLNQMTATEMAIPGRRYVISGGGYSTEGTIKRVAGEPDVPLDEYLLPMILASDAVVQDGRLIGDPTELALVVLAEKGGLDADATREKYPRVAVLPFDAAYKMMASFHEISGKVQFFVKGAPDQVLARCSVTPEQHERYLAENERLARQGLRVMATARGTADAVGDDLLGMLENLEPLALVGIVDPPRPQAKDAIEQAHAAGIEVRMITGDHAITAAAIAGKLGIRGRAITGAEFGAMSDEEADREIDGIGVIARVTPEHKVRLVEVLRRKGHIVAMTGDGVNDAPALKKADIGIAMGITGTEVSKEAAAMILTDDDFATIVKAVELGRALYANLKKYIFFQMGVLAAMIVTFLAASIGNIAGGVPFLPLQTLWLNFTTQVFQSVGLGYGTAEPDIMRRPPRRSDEPLLTNRVLGWLGLMGVFMGAITLLVLWFAERDHDIHVARTMGLTAFSLMNLIFSVTVRSDIRSVFSRDTFDDRRFLITSGMSLAAIVLATELGLIQRLLGTVSLDLGQWGICLLAALTVIVPTEIRKAVLRRRAGRPS
ncbi:cation-transporting P-type ATPase [Actinoplanes sp. L3-i22]|uniref:cation-translocating P-type ATPase n=1 Tax=Actinoplanes sp. L3-i22 TaxID=2836373 RepID=UPI0021029954|nr:cation-transporting P-type ATPase [Actinoplanes sp. L3-i22]